MLDTFPHYTLQYYACNTTFRFKLIPSVIETTYIQAMNVIGGDPLVCRTNRTQSHIHHPETDDKLSDSFHMSPPQIDVSIIMNHNINSLLYTFVYYII